MSDGSAADGSPEREPEAEETVTEDLAADRSVVGDDDADDFAVGNNVAGDDVPKEDTSGDDEELASRQARLEAAKRRYRATLRNEAETEGGGFSEDYYRSQKPPHW